MGKPLTKTSFMECRRHGVRKPTFICHHLQHGTGLGFHQPGVPLDPELPFECAWCDDCHRVLAEQEYEWNDVSEGYARVIAICEGCFEEIRARNGTVD